MTKGKEDERVERRKRKRRESDDTCGACFSEDFDMLNTAFYELKDSYGKLSASVKANSSWYTWGFRFLMLVVIAGGFWSETGVRATETKTDDLDHRVTYVEVTQEQVVESQVKMAGAIKDNVAATSQNTSELKEIKKQMESIKLDNSEQTKILREIADSLK